MHRTQAYIVLDIVLVLRNAEYPFYPYNCASVDHIIGFIVAGFSLYKIHNK